MRLGGMQTTPDPAAPRPVGPLVACALVAAGYALGAELSWGLFGAGVGLAFFPPAGVTLAALDVLERRRWPAVVAVVVAVEVAVDARHHLRLPVALGYALANTVEPLVGATLLRRWRVGARRSWSLRSRSGVTRFALAALVAGPAAGALIGATVKALETGTGSWAGHAVQFGAGDGLGVLVVAAPLLAALEPAGRARLRPWPLLAGLLAAAAAVAWGVLWQSDLPLGFLVLPLLLVAAFRFDVVGAGLAGACTAVIADAATSHGRGPFATAAVSTQTQLGLTKLFLGVTILTAWIFAVEIDERRRAEQARRREADARLAAENDLLVGELAKLLGQKIVTRDVFDALAGWAHERLRAGAVALVVDDGTPDRLLAWGDLPAWAGEVLAARHDDWLAYRLDEHGGHHPYSVTALPDGAGALGLFWPDDAAAAPVAMPVGAVVQVAAQALARAVLAGRHAAVAHELQQAMLTTNAIDDDRVRVAARYLPAVAGLDVGGDWYQVAVLPGGAIGVAVGDVVGRGIPAAAAMGQLRVVVETLWQDTDDPARVLTQLDLATRRLPNATGTTCFVAVVEPATETIRWASAGHLAPVAVAPGGTAAPLAGAPGPPLHPAAPRLVVRACHTARFDRGTILLAFTDGLVERRDGGVDPGLARLVASATRHADGDLDALVDRVLADCLAGTEHRDDVAIVALRLDAAADRSGLPTRRLPRLVPPAPEDARFLDVSGPGART